MLQEVLCPDCKLGRVQCSGFAMTQGKQETTRTLAGARTFAPAGEPLMEANFQCLACEYEWTLWWRCREVK